VRLFTLPDEFHLQYTEWSFLRDLARYYHLEPWSDEHWRWPREGVADMALPQQDMILTSFTLVKVTQSAAGS
jgi:hypothetical protein